MAQATCTLTEQFVAQSRASGLVTKQREKLLLGRDFRFMCFLRLKLQLRLLLGLRHEWFEPARASLSDVTRVSAVTSARTTAAGAATPPPPGVSATGSRRQQVASEGERRKISQLEKSSYIQHGRKILYTLVYTRRGPSMSCLVLTVVLTSPKPSSPADITMSAVAAPKLFGKWCGALPQLDLIFSMFSLCPVVCAHRSFEDIEISDISLEDYIAAKVRTPHRNLLGSPSLTSPG